jgi:hypothetical protein
MVNVRKFPYCRNCRKTRDEKEEQTTNPPSKRVCCGICGQMLAWAKRRQVYKPWSSGSEVMEEKKSVRTDITKTNTFQNWSKLLKSKKK